MITVDSSCFLMRMSGVWRTVLPRQAAVEKKTVYNSVKHDILLYIVQICLLLLPVNIIMHTDTLSNGFIMISFTKCFSCALMTGVRGSDVRCISAILA